MVDNHVGNSLQSFRLEVLNHGLQLLLGAEGTVVVAGKPVAVIVAHGGAVAVAALWNPDEVEGGGQFVSLAVEHGPVRIVEGVPVEGL